MARVASALMEGEALPAPFVVGVPRSGTTLLRLQLDAHPELAIPAETGFGALLAEFAAHTPGPEELVDRIARLDTWPDLAVERDELAAIFSGVRRWSVAEGMRAYYRWYATRHGKRRWGDKTPVHAEYLNVLAAAFPEARFVHIIRDGRDVAASLTGLSFAPGDGGIEAVATVWRDGIARARAAAESVPHYYELRYEDLATKPERTLRELCEFLDLAFDPAMLHAHTRARERLAELGVVKAAGGVEGVRGERRHNYMRLQSPPDTGAVGRWRDVFTAQEAERIEQVAGRMLAALGYELGLEIRERR